MVNGKEFLRSLENPNDEIEAEIFKDMKERLIQKMAQSKQNLVLINPVTEVKRVVKKLPLIDKMRFDNGNFRSLAESKKRWKGRKGKFKKKDLAQWFKVYDETKLWEIRQEIKKDVE